MFFYVEPGEEAVSKALKKCGELMTSGVAIVIPQLSNLSGFISNVIGDEAVKVLTKHKVLDLETCKLHLFTKRQPPRFFKGPLLVAFTPVAQLQTIIKDNPGADIVFVPWTPEEKEFFIARYSPQLI